jgi:hypothetical protein
MSRTRGHLGADSISSCSVCGAPVTAWAVRQAWLSVRVATDVLPLLVNACSEACVQALPQGAERHVRVPHSGGRGVEAPSAEHPPGSRPRLRQSRLQPAARELPAPPGIAVHRPGGGTNSEHAAGYPCALTLFLLP